VSDVWRQLINKLIKVISKREMGDFPWKMIYWLIKDGCVVEGDHQLAD